VLVAAAATTYVVLGGDDGGEQAAPVFSTGSTMIELPDDVLDTLADDTREQSAPVEPGAPVRLLIPSLDVDSEVVPITAPGGVLTPPDDGQQVGWWSPGAEPGAEQGSALLTGHTLSRGGAALQDLEVLEPGDRIAVRTTQGRIAYRVEDVAVFDKGTVAEEATELFSQSVPGRLVVVTCEDYDGSVYLSNVVVTATPTGGATVAS
jgi:LPXTG-site transpeptidase (sortase) family protein